MKTLRLTDIEIEDILHNLSWEIRRLGTLAVEWTKRKDNDQDEYAEMFMMLFWRNVLLYRKILKS